MEERSMDRQTDLEPGAGAPRPAPPPAGPPAAGPAPDADSAALQGTRFEFGGRRPLSVPPPRVTYRAPQRPLPGIGTVALGKVARVAPYGAFVDFLGFRGLVHISQLLPGYRVERVEDVVEAGSEVVVRVIAVDPERRHINLALVPDASDAVQAQTHAAAPVASATPVTAPVASATPVTAPASPVPSAAAAAASIPARPASPSEPVASSPPAPPESAAPAGPPAPAPMQAAPPVPPPAPPLPPRQPRPAPAAQTPPKRDAAPRRTVSHHASRAVHREMTDPTHPMARLLAAAGARALRSDTLPEAPGGDASSGGPRPAPQPVEELRPVHVSEPEPEPETDAPATLESLAARFGPGRPAGTKERQGKGTRDRSRAAREEQAAILARLRQQDAP